METATTKNNAPIEAPVKGTVDWCVKNLNEGRCVYLNMLGAEVLFNHLQLYYRDMKVKVSFAGDKTYFIRTT